MLNTEQGAPRTLRNNVLRVFWRQVLTREQMKKKSEKLLKSKQRVPVF